MSDESLERASSFRVLVLGNVPSSEMRPVVADVADVFAGSPIRLEPFEQPTDESDLDWNPALIVVCQSRPDQFTRDTVQRLMARFPIARWVCCFGAWCEADGRTRDIWPTSIRVPARLARSRLLRERDVLTGKRAALPLTAGRDETFEFDHSANRNEELTLPRRMSVAVVSADRELQRCFEARLQKAGLRTVAASGTTEPDCLLCDADPWNEQTAAQFRRLRQRHSQSAVIALANFFHVTDRRAMQRCGADRVLPKLADDRELLAVIETQAADCDGRDSNHEYRTRNVES